MPAMNTPFVLPTVNGVVLAYPQETLDDESLRQRACTELLRQATIAAGLLSDEDPAPLQGAITDDASTAIEALLDQVLQRPEPTDDDCRRHHAAHLARYAVGERAQVRHVLFAVTPGVDVNALRQRAEACLLDLRCDGSGGRFGEVARTTSNCPSGADGGELGWLGAEDCAPELAREILGRAEIGVLPRLVATRFGLHVVEVLAREPGAQPPYEAVRSAVAQALRQQAFATALRQYLQVLAGQAELRGVDLEAAATPLVQ
ncbi:MAG: peptidylprolyl isomerase [Leptothrix sp. (in: Bacteria)]|nr:peptidylprolyl isomerase [Leptothrix sp. (in: b-proteobacteria)]